MTAISVNPLTWIEAPAPVKVVKPSTPPKPKTLARIALQDRDPERNILKLEMSKAMYSQYRQRLLKRNGHCVYCQQELKEATATLDHVLPKSRGGLNSPGNLFLACERCNNAKGDRTPLEWMEAIYQACLEMGVIDELDVGAMDYWYADGMTTG